MCFVNSDITTLYSPFKRLFCQQQAIPEPMRSILIKSNQTMHAKDPLIGVQIPDKICSKAGNDCLL